jgi:hypothetical protein
MINKHLVKYVIDLYHSQFASQLMILNIIEFVVVVVEVAVVGMMMVVYYWIHVVVDDESEYKEKLMVKNLQINIVNLVV